jgi:hypothetical protein
VLRAAGHVFTFAGATVIFGSGERPVREWAPGRYSARHISGSRAKAWQDDLHRLMEDACTAARVPGCGSASLPVSERSGTGAGALPRLGSTTRRCLGCAPSGSCSPFHRSLPPGVRSV